MINDKSYRTILCLAFTLGLLGTTTTDPVMAPAAAQDHGGHGTGGFNSTDIAPGGRWSRTFDQAGDFSYVCHPHPFMKGKITVTSTDASARSGTVDVRIQNYSFQPATLVIRPGTTVRWTNDDAVVHTATQEVADGGFTILGLPWWQALLAAAALVAGGVLMFLRPKRKKGA